MILRRVGLFGLAQAAALAAGLALQVVVARALGAGDYGRFIVAHSVSLAALGLLMSAVPNALRRLVSVNRGNLQRAWRAVWLVQLPIAIAFAAALAGLAPLLAGAMRDVLLVPALVVVAAELAIKAGVLEPGWHLLNGLGRHALQAGLMTGHSLLRVTCVVCLLGVSVGLVESLAGLLVSATVSAAVVVPIVRRLAKSTPGRPDGGFARELLRWARLAPGVDALNYLLVAANLWVLKAMTVDASLVGAYAACSMLAQAILPFSLVLSRAAFAPFARAVSEGGTADAARLLCQASRLAILGAGWGAAVSVGCGDAVVSLMYGSGFAAPGTLLALLVSGMAGTAWLWFLCEMLGAAGRLKARLRLMAAVFAASVAATLVLTRAFGPWGCAWTLAIAGWLGALAASVCLGAAAGAFVPWRSLFRAAVASAALVAVARLGQPAGPGPTVLAGILGVSVGYLAMLALLQEWNLAQWQSAWRVLRGLGTPATEAIPEGERYA